KLNFDNGIAKLRAILSPFSKVFSVELTTNELFSHEDANQMLVYRASVQSSVSRSQADSIFCRLMDMQNKVRFAGKTNFFILIAPNKLTAYSEFIADPNLRMESVDAHIARDGLSLIRADLSLKAAIRNGKKDI